MTRADNKRLNATTSPAAAGCANRYLTRAEVALELSVTEKTVDRMRAKGLLPEPVYIKGAPRWVRVDLFDWVESGKADERRVS